MQDQRASGFCVWWEASSWFIGGLGLPCLLTRPRLGLSMQRKAGGLASLPLVAETLLPSWGSTPMTWSSGQTTSQKPGAQSPLHWAFGLRHRHVGWMHVQSITVPNLQMVHSRPVHFHPFFPLLWIMPLINHRSGFFWTYLAVFREAFNPVSGQPLMPARCGRAGSPGLARLN